VSVVIRSFDNEIEVDLPIVAKAVVRVSFDFPSARIAGRLGVSAPDPDINILDRHIPQPVVLG
jgi:hypothetical protein